MGPTEIGGFGISANGNLLLIEDVALVRQSCDWASVAFDDAAVADFFDEQVDAGRRPAEFGRIWVHTHPGDSPRPSQMDEETFGRVFGKCDWSVMLIVARGGVTYCRLQFGVGPGGSMELAVEVDYGGEFDATDRAAWQGEFESCVFQNERVLPLAPGTVSNAAHDNWERQNPRLEDATLWEFPSHLTQEQHRDGIQ